MEQNTVLELFDRYGDTIMSRMPTSPVSYLTRKISMYGAYLTSNEIEDILDNLQLSAAE